MYFRGEWSSYFEKNNTRLDNFKLDNKKSINVNFTFNCLFLIVFFKLLMMNQKTQIPYIDWFERQCKIIELPYNNKNVSMYILLPDKISSVNELFKSLNNFKDISIIFNAQRKSQRLVDVSIPRFNQTSFHNLQPILENIGLQNLFINPNLTNISNQILKINYIHQKTIVDVNFLLTNFKKSSFYFYF